MQLDYPPAMAFDSRTPGPMDLWLLLAIIGVVLGSAALIAALAGPGSDIAGVHLALGKVCIL